MVCKAVTAPHFIELIKENSELLIIDCRSFLIFNKGHISGASNVRCNSIMRRRNKGQFALENAITNSDKRQDFLSGRISTVVLYDEQNEELTIEDKTTKKSRRTMAMVMEVLMLNAVPSTTISYLNCSYKEFSMKYPEKCDGCTRTSLPLMETEPQTAQTSPSAILTPVYDQGVPVEILPHLYLGSAHHASHKSQLMSMGISAILNASSTSPNYFEDTFKYRRISVEDNCHADISKWFNSAISFINDVKENGGKVFVHCHAGVSRSATLCLAYLITCQGISLNDAFRYVKHRRSVISPNFNFMGQLLKLETDLASKNQGCRSQSQLAFDFKAPSNAVVEEMEWQDENQRPSTCHKVTLGKGKLFRRRTHTTMTPLAAINNQSEANSPKLCLTAPAKPKDVKFFHEAKRSCGQQSAMAYPHRHSRAVTLST